MALLTAFAMTGPVAAGTDKPTGPAQLIEVRLQPVRISPNAQGALLLSEATGCFVEFVGHGSAEGVYQFRLAPTAKVSSIDKCLASLRQQPGITAASVARL